MRKNERSGGASGRVLLRPSSSGNHADLLDAAEGRVASSCTVPSRTVTDVRSSRFSGFTLRRLRRAQQTEMAETVQLLMHEHHKGTGELPADWLTPNT